MAAIASPRRRDCLCSGARPHVILFVPRVTALDVEPYGAAMAISEQYRQHLLLRLNAVTRVTDRRMFGGLGLYAGDRFFALVDGDVLYLKVDDTSRADFEALGSSAFRPFGERGPTMNFYALPERILDRPGELAVWITQAIDVAQRAARPAKQRARALPTRSQAKTPARARKAASPRRTAAPRQSQRRSTQPRKRSNTKSKP